MPNWKSETARDAAPETVAEPGVMQAGLLLETVQQQQTQVEGMLRRLELWSCDLDGVVRECLHQCLRDELQSAGQAARQTGDALQAVRRQARIRVGAWSLGLMLACGAVPLTLAWAFTPGREQIARQRREYEDLVAKVESLKALGGHIDVRRCGPSPRMCVRVNRKAPAYGDGGDYLVIEGY